MTNRLAIFDCDGTLVDSQANIHAAMMIAASPRPGWLRRIAPRCAGSSG